MANFCGIDFISELSSLPTEWAVLAEWSDIGIHTNNELTAPSTVTNLIGESLDHNSLRVTKKKIGHPCNIDKINIVSTIGVARRRPYVVSKTRDNKEGNNHIKKLAHTTAPLLMSQFT